MKKLITTSAAKKMPKTNSPIKTVSSKKNTAKPVKKTTVTPFRTGTKATSGSKTIQKPAAAATTAKVPAKKNTAAKAVSTAQTKVPARAKAAAVTSSAAKGKTAKVKPAAAPNQQQQQQAPVLHRRPLIVFPK